MKRVQFLPMYNYEHFCIVHLLDHTIDAENPSFLNFSKYSLLDLLLLFDTKKILLPSSYKLTSCNVHMYHLHLLLT